MSTEDLLDRVRTLARDLRWTWSPTARNLFAALDPAGWRASGHDPFAVLADLDPLRREVLAEDPDFAALVAAAEAERDAYRDAVPWFVREHGDDPDLQVAYLCMEYGIHESLPLYSGGLGVLAGDHLKSASDLGIPMTAVGILWHEGYYRQEIRPDGGVRVLYPSLDLDLSPLEDTSEVVDLDLGGESVAVGIWRLQVGSVDLYLLDTDLEANSPAARDLSRRLYGGDQEHRVRQEVLLGTGGVHALDHLGVTPTVWHLNEGHAAFAGIERLRRHIADGATYPEALAAVRESTVFTTHTPVPGGNDRFPPDLVMRYLGEQAGRVGLDRKEFLALGREDPGDTTEDFCMTVLALKLAARANGVAELHGDTARRMWTGVYGLGEPRADDVPIGHVTNGVHPPTWIGPQAWPMYRDELDAEFVAAGPDHDPWSRLDGVSDEQLWGLRQWLRAELITEVRGLLRDQHLAHAGLSEELGVLYRGLDEDVLTIGFARRFATYKRAPLIFTDPDRLEAIVADQDRPVQLLFAGKAHPRDQAGHEFVQRVHEMSRHEAWRGRIHILQDYDLHLGRLLTRGCDVWLNNPIRPMEASGTSGMKGPLNGGINCSVLDGWWAEAFTGDNGWSLGGDQGLPRDEQDAADARSLYDTLEAQVVPAFYDRDEAGIPRAWVRRMRASMTSCFPRFSTYRMLRDYLEDYYLPAHDPAHDEGRRQ